jgi:hypothetical protein
MTPASAIHSEYLMTLHASGASAHPIDSSLTIYYSGSEGSAKGPRIEAAIVAPTADWLRVMPSGSLRVDARMTLRTHDGALIYVSYGGVIRIAADDFQRMAAGAELGSEHMYFVITPCFQTSHPNYLWLNGVQAVGKAVGLKGGGDGFVRYEVFAVR